MDKIIVERPRHGSRMRGPGKSYRRAWQGLAWEDQPKREKIRLEKSKSFNEHLGPLRRYLRSQVGRPWCKVHAEICAHISRDSAVQDHVRDHVDGYVETRVEFVNGVACHAAGWNIGRPLVSLFYVCPRSGILKENVRGRSWKRARLAKPLTLVALTQKETLIRWNGAWLVVQFQQIPQGEWCASRRRFLAPWEIRRWDELQGRWLNVEDTQRIYGQPNFVCKTRSPRRIEIRSAVNSYPYTNLVRQR